MAQGKTYKLEYLEGDEWRAWGIYPEKFINQLMAGICELYKRGYMPYASIRVTEVE
jgi:hypothetical protein